MRSISTLLLFPFLVGALLAQGSMQQDPSLNNLVHPDGYKTAATGTFGDVTKRGSGPVPLILIPGAGFGWQVFEDFIPSLESEFTVYAVTLAGMGGTAAAPMPPAGTSYGEQTWIRGAVRAVVNLIESEKLDRPLVVGHFLEGSHVALRMGIDHPELIRGAVTLAGAAEMASPETAAATLQMRISYMDTQMAPNWFKTVTLETWNDNNFPAASYARDPETAAAMWKRVSSGPLPVFIRYLMEFWAADYPSDFPKVQVPTLILMPDFDTQLSEDPDYAWLDYYFTDSWKEAAANPKMATRTIADSHINMWLDQPEAVRQAILNFAQSLPR